MNIKINDVELTSGDHIAISPNLTVIVGPNNVGKSMLLNSLFVRLSETQNQQPPSEQIVASLQLNNLTYDQLIERLAAKSELRPPGTYPQSGYLAEPSYLVSGNQVIPRSLLLNSIGISNPINKLGPVASVVATLIQPEQRLGQLATSASFNPTIDSASTPMQKLFRDRELEDKVRELTKRAFNSDITINRHAGREISLHMGRPSSREPRQGDNSPYYSELAALPLAQAQGHGIQAFLGIILAIVAGSYDIVLIDEPEAFLHPPQMRLLGEMFVGFSRDAVQIIVSTHSDDFLRGVLTAAGSTTETTVARITRPNPTTNSVAQISSRSLQRLYEDPLLRYSDILDGIFYKGVVMCEAEGDCKYYAATLDYTIASADGPAMSPDILFTQCGGRDRLAKGVKALKAARVPTAVIADIDLLSDKAKFEEVYISLGGSAGALQSQLNVLQSNIHSKSSPVDRDYAQTKINDVLNASTSNELTANEIKSIRKHIRATSGWELIKKNGKGAVSSGDPSTAFDTILEEAKKVGLFLVPVGELERFHPLIAGDKQKWLREVFENRSV